MSLYLGIDGGGTGCRAAIADAHGAVLGRADAGPANIISDPNGARSAIVGAATSALVQAFGHADDLRRLHAGLGLAGANAAGAAAHLALGLPFASVRIETDAITGLRGALGDADGIVASLGTGSVYAIQHAGAIRQIGGWGLILGDEASGAWIGRAALALALRAEDGLVSDTPFLAELRRRHGGASGVVRFAATATASLFAALAPEVMAAKDSAAADIVAAGVADVRAMIDRLRLGNDLPVTFIGGLGPVYARHLADMAQRPAVGSALDGALSLARLGAR